MTDNSVLEAAFARAVDLTGDERARFMAQFFRDHPQLAPQLDALLRADAGSDAQIGDAVARSLERFNRAETDAFVGRTMGAWTIIRRIGSGGMGAVFLAERSGAFAQTAALKIMSAQLVRSDARARFESERQILAQLRHPYIGTLIDGGTDEVGLPYLVIEYVDGLAVDRYCNEHRLGLRARLDMVRRICAAVDYAHRNLVVHRDIKPSNILVDKDGNPKLLDFGIAKLLAADDAPVGDQTEPQSRAWTPEYASPEQVRGEPVSVASDVYALGVLLYRLLTDRSPFGKLASSRFEIESQIIEAEPERPSQAVTRASDTGSAQGAAEASAASPLPALVSPATLKRQLRGDLDNIILKCLEKDPERRYPSVRALADDLERYLRQEPVAARGTSFAYRARKFVARNTAPVLAASAGIIAVIGLTVLYTVQLAQERDAARLAAAQAEEVSGFLRDLFGAASPAVAQGEEVTATDLLKAGLERVDALSDQPAVQAQLLDVIATSYAGLGQFGEGEAAARRALAIREANAPDDRMAMVSSINAIMENQQDTESRKDLLDLARRALAIVEADPVAQPQLVARQKGRLGRALFRMKKYEEAAVELEAALALKQKLGQPPDADLLAITGDLANTYDYLERFDEARPLFRANAKASDRLLGPNHPDAIVRQADLGLFLARTGFHLEAVDAFAEALRRAERVMPADHPYPYAFKRELGYTQFDAGLFAEARETLESLVADVIAQRGENHPQFIALSRNLGQTMIGAGDFAQGEAMLMRSAKSAAAQDERLSYHIRWADVQIARSYNFQGRFAEAERRVRKALDAGSLGPDYGRYAALELAVSISGQGRLAEADEAFRAVIAQHEEELGPDSFLLTDVLAHYADHCRRAGRLSEAEASARRGLAIGSGILGRDNWRTALATAQLAYALIEQGKREEAAPLLAEARAVLDPIMRPDHPVRVQLAAFAAR